MKRRTRCTATAVIFESLSPRRWYRLRSITTVHRCSSTLSCRHVATRRDGDSNVSANGNRRRNFPTRVRRSCVRPWSDLTTHRANLKRRVTYVRHQDTRSAARNRYSLHNLRTTFTRRPRTESFYTLPVSPVYYWTVGARVKTNENGKMVSRRRRK